MALGNAAECQKAFVTGECIFSGFAWRLEALDWDLLGILPELLTRKMGQSCIGERRKLLNSESRQSLVFPSTWGFRSGKKAVVHSSLPKCFCEHQCQAKFVKLCFHGGNQKF